LLDEFRPDAIVLDLMMPEVDGVQVLHHLVERQSRAGIIIASGGEPRILDVTTRLAKSLGLNLVGTLTKPVGLTELADMLRAALPIAAQVSDADLRRAIRGGEIIPFFQPKVAVNARNRIVGAEVLARWSHEQRGMLSPDVFVRLAEETGMIGELTLALMSEALKQAKANAVTSPLSINLSPLSLDDRNLPDEMEACCRDNGVEPGSIVFEITEGVASRDFNAVMGSLARLRLKGFGLSMDDYGTGYSSLVHLVRLPFGEVKIDRSFVSEIGSLRDAEIVVRSTISMAHSMGLVVCAEGVETEDTIRFLGEASCDTMQGHKIAQAMPIDQFADFLQWRLHSRPTSCMQDGTADSFGS
jgi:EAL domain-containing protein (putative c-di-GMP-specific phosphodiesterase class I)